MSSIHMLCLDGDCNIANARALHRDLRDAFDRGAAVTVDCRGVERADVSLLQLLLSSQTTFFNRGLDFRIVDPAGVVGLLATRGGFRFDAVAGHIF
ncbi:STAS domain-containing protein [Methylocella silvestris]|uniref:STAS domain-containing protein n=1 Tax=Methylocella silvestris TaxID=199596 RepID=A0A2J7TE82_METSI|nr:STAS domain-containing protein [Methylocella silvestris]PNG25066.1 hypothetical protein CR492_15600 [Methylocella silvestris]